MLGPDPNAPAPLAFGRDARVHPAGVPAQLGTYLGLANDGLWAVVRWDHEPLDHLALVPPEDLRATGRTA